LAIFINKGVGTTRAMGALTPAKSKPWRRKYLPICQVYQLVVSHHRKWFCS